jgi:pyruvate dehydrogenase E2 component (dihydrolipoamide acetyltransferase)
MAEVIKMPLLSDTMKEGVVAEWHKKVGDKVKENELIAEIESDKATMEFESPVEGVLLYHADAGKPIAVNAILAIVGTLGEDISAYLNENSSTNATEKTSSDPELTPTPEPQAMEVVDTNNDNGRLKVSPVAKSMATENHIDIKKVKGTGDDGRIIKRDIEAILQTTETKVVEITPSVTIVPPPVETIPIVEPTTQTVAPAAQATEQIRTAFTYIGTEQYNDVRVSQMRKVIARRLTDSKNTAPHFYLKLTVNMNEAVKFRQAINEFSPVKISFNDIVIKACAMALRQHSSVNSSWLDDKIRYNHHISIGMAVALEDGLVVPVIRFADNKSLGQISTEAKDLGAKARDKKLSTPDMQGNTFTISNLGMFDVEEFTAIINPPDACILAVGTIKEMPAIENGTVVAQQQMKLTLSCDHRVVDGATGAKFLQTLQKLLENPMSLMV